MKLITAFFFLGALTFCACGTDHLRAPDGGAGGGEAGGAGGGSGGGSGNHPDAGGPNDAGSDAGLVDGGADAGVPDAGDDAGTADAGSDAGTADAGSDAGTADAGSDAGPADAGSDAGPVDAGSDAGPVDAGPADAGSDAGSTGGGGPLACAMLVYPAGNEPSVTLPLSIVYPADADASVPGMGSNDSYIGYTIAVIHVSGDTQVSFGVANSDVNEGVPWDDDAGVLTDGLVPAFAIDIGNPATSNQIVLTFDTPVFGFKFAVTDLDHSVESVQVDAFASADGGVVALTNHLLSDPAALPELALGMPHTGNDSYIVDQTKVQLIAPGVFSVSSTNSGDSNDQTGTVLFAYDDVQPIERIEVTYSASDMTGIWLAGFQYYNMCGRLGGIFKAK